MCHIDRFSENEHIIDHDIEIPRPKSHDIEITRPKNRDIGKQRQITHDIVIPRHFFRGQKATTSRFQNCNKATTSSFRGILKATTPTSCGTLTLMSPDNHMTITSHTWLFSRLCRAKWSVRIGDGFSILLCKCEIRQIPSSKSKRVILDSKFYENMECHERGLILAFSPVTTSLIHQRINHAEKCSIIFWKR